MQELIERLEKATGPDRSLDGDIALASGEATGWVERFGERVPGLMAKGLPPTTFDAPAYTASIDAALTLVPEDLFLGRLCQLSPTSWFAMICSKVDDHLGMEGEASTAAIALCIAALKARLAIGERRTG